MKKMEMPVGKKIRGYGLLNEYGEFDFIPEQTGLREGQVKLLFQGDEYTISTTKKLVVIHVRLEKVNGLELVKKYFSTMNKIFDKLKNYDF